MSACPYCDNPFDGAKVSQASVLLRACPKCRNAFVVRRDGGALTTEVIDGVQDLRAVIAPNSLAEAVFSELDEAMERLPVLPEIVEDVLGVVRDPESSMADLVRAIGHDQAIAARVLRVANSAMFGGLHEIDDLRAACARLGMKTVANTVMAVSQEQFYSAKDSVFRDMMKYLWQHALATAHCASELAMVLAAPRGEALFVAGLVHDIGILVLIDIVANSKKTLLRQLVESPDLICEVFDSFHTIVGLHAVHHWALPPELCLTTFCHHQPELVQGPADHQSMCHLVCMANCVAAVAGFGFEEEGVVPSLLSHPSAKFLGLSDVKLASLRVALEDRLTAAVEAMSGQGDAD